MTASFDRFFFNMNANMMSNMMIMPPIAAPTPIPALAPVDRDSFVTVGVVLDEEPVVEGLFVAVGCVAEGPCAEDAGTVGVKPCI